MGQADWIGAALVFLVVYIVFCLCVALNGIHYPILSHLIVGARCLEQHLGEMATFYTTSLYINFLPPFLNNLLLSKLPTPPIAHTPL
jgi:hypothetical protein